MSGVCHSPGLSLTTYNSAASEHVLKSDLVTSPVHHSSSLEFSFYPYMVSLPQELSNQLIPFCINPIIPFIG